MVAIASIVTFSCNTTESGTTIKPLYTSEPVEFDTDDSAI